MFRIPRELFQPRSEDHGENSGITEDGGGGEGRPADYATPARAGNRGSGPIALTGRRPASLLLRSQLPPGRRTRTPRYRRAQLRPRGAALFPGQCFKLRAEPVRPIRKRGLKPPIRGGQGGGARRESVCFWLTSSLLMWVRVTNCRDFLSGWLWASSHLTLSL